MADPKTFVIKDSGGPRDTFPGGAVRDSQDDKPRYELIPPEPLRRLAMHYTNGSKKYSAFNWCKGMSMERILASLLRHIEQYRSGDRSEDHLAAVAWNAFALMHFETTNWNDLFDWTPRERPVEPTS